MRGVGDDAGLRSRVARRAASPLVDRDPQERHRDPLSRGEQHVHLARVGVRRDVLRHPSEVVGGLAHRRDHHDHVVAGIARADDPVGDDPEPIDAVDGGATVFLHDDGHVEPSVAARSGADWSGGLERVDPSSRPSA